MANQSRSDLWHDLAPLFRRLGPNWVQRSSSKHRDSLAPRAALLSIRQVAQFLGVSTATVYRLCEAGELPHLRVSHGDSHPSRRPGRVYFRSAEGANSATRAATRTTASDWAPL